MTPLVSFVIMGRNDGYMGDYLYRLGTALSFLGESAEAAGLRDEIETVVVDWGSHEPLSRHLPLTAAARHGTRFLEVTPALLRARYGSERWYPSAAVNVGVRRARGQFIIFTDSDCLWTQPSLEALVRLLRGQTALPVPIDDVYCYVRRYQVPWAAVQRKPRLGEWRRLTALLTASVQSENPAGTFIGGFSAGQLMHRRLWHEVRGYDESLDKAWGWSDNDLVFRVCQEHAWIDVSAYGVFGLHMEHWPHTMDRAARDQSTVNPMLVRNAPVSNPASWGLGDVAVAETTSHCDEEPSPGTGCAIGLTGHTAAHGWQPGPEADRFVRRLKVLGDPTVPESLLRAVAQIALADRPLTIYWFGTLVPPVLHTLVQASPSAELYLINPWPEGSAGEQPFHPGQLSGQIQSWGFKGWARIVQGTPETALTRIAASRIGDAPIEFAWIDPATPGSLWPEIAARLAPGGVVVMPSRGGRAETLVHLRNAMPSTVVQARYDADLLIATRPVDTGVSAPMTTPESTPTREPMSREAESLRVVLDMLLKDKALAAIDADAIAWDQPLLVIRSAHMGRMEAFFQLVAARCASPTLHVVSHARDEEALRAMAPFPIVFHAYETPGPYRLDAIGDRLLSRLRATCYGALFYLDAGTRAQGLDEVERLLAAIQPEPIVCFMGNNALAKAPSTKQRQLAKAAFLGLVQWYEHRLDPAGTPART